MNKKLIISKTITFICIVAFIIGFKTLFGAENTLIGVTTITALLMFLEKDLTLEPFRNTVKLICLNLFIGVAATLASSNMWVAIVVNLVTVFFIGYRLCYNLNKPMYLPFLLQYLFILATPVPVNELPRRFVSLIIGALAIMGAQLICNRDKVSKHGNKLLVNVCDDICTKIIRKERKQGVKDLEKSINTSLNSFKKIIFDKREQNFYLTEESRIKLNICMALEKINILVDKLNFKQIDKTYLDDINRLLDNVKEGLKNEVGFNRISSEEFEKYKGCENIVFLEILSSIEFIYESLEEVKELEHKNSINKITEVPKTFKSINVFIRNINSKSVKFSYAVRIAIGITLGCFIMDVFKLTEGRWIMFTALSLINPIYEVAKQKTKDRIIATFIGSVIVVILFSIFKGTTTRTLLLMLSGYLSSYTKQYKHNMIFVTVSAIGAASLMSNVGVLSINRILFVCLGAVISILINKFILPCDIVKQTENLKYMYKQTINEMIKELCALSEGRKDENTMKNLFITTSLIEDRLILDNQAVGNKEDGVFIEDQRLLVCNIYELYMWIKNNKVKRQDIQYILEDMKRLVEYNYLQVKQIKKEFRKYIKHTKAISDKIVLSNLMSILDILDKVKNDKTSVA
ncbi:MAG: FUSC family protein [Sarcina sp.]